MYRCGLYTFVLTDAIARPTQLGHNLSFSTAGMLCPEYLSLTQVRWTDSQGAHFLSSPATGSPFSLQFARAHGRQTYKVCATPHNANLKRFD